MGDIRGFAKLLGVLAAAVTGWLVYLAISNGPSGSGENSELGAVLGVFLAMTPYTMMAIIGSFSEEDAGYDLFTDVKIFLWKTSPFRLIIKFLRGIVTSADKHL